VTQVVNSVLSTAFDVLHLGALMPGRFSVIYLNIKSKNLVSSGLAVSEKYHFNNGNLSRIYIISAMKCHLTV
jgi:hypothetical protein